MSPSQGILRRSVVLSAAMILVALFALAGCQQEAPSDAYRIGAVTSLTGSYASMGRSAKQAIDLEVDRINDAGGINGKRLEVLIEDDGTDNSRAVAATAKLIERDKVLALIGATGTGTSMAMRGDVKRADIVQISPAGGTAITDVFDPLVFQTPWSNRLVIPYVLSYMESQGHRRVALLSDAGGYGRDGRAVILQLAADHGIEIVADETFNPGDTDMSAQLIKARASSADALLIWAAGKEATTIAKNKAQLGIDLPWYGGSGQARVEFVQGAGVDAEGFVFATGKSLIPSNWEDAELRHINEDFSARYEARYGEAPDIFAGHAFDAIRILEDALLRMGGGEISRETLRDSVESTRNLSGFGGVFNFSPDNHNGLGSDDLTLYRVENGKWVSLR